MNVIVVCFIFFLFQMKITIHWDRVAGILIALLVVIAAILLFNSTDRRKQQNHDDIGQCDMHEAQQIIDNLVSSLCFFYPD